MLYDLHLCCLNTLRYLAGCCKNDLKATGMRLENERRGKKKNRKKTWIKKFLSTFVEIADFYNELTTIMPSSHKQIESR